MSRFVVIFLASIISFLANAGQVDSLKEKHLKDLSLEAPIYPSWTHKHWVWENAGDQNSAWALTQDYKDKDFPVGVVIIDRPWDTEPNSFIPSPTLYPDLGKYIERWHAQDVKVVMWATSVINQGAETFQEAKDKGYLYRGKTDLEWWAGVGGLLDYENPEALSWWERQMDRILALNIDGWKVDATDPMVIKLHKATEALQKWNKYKKLEYNHFFDYTRKKLGNDRLIMARPVDDYIGWGLPITFARPKISFAAWVGDQDGTFKGLKHALVNMLASARLDYPVIGSDIGGFRNDGDNPMRDKKLMVRWTQLGALMPLMENGGGGEHRPWKYDSEVESIYRKYAYFHESLVPYFYSTTNVAYQKDKSPVKPVNKNFAYKIGNDIFVSPIYTNKDDVSVCLPTGKWKYAWNESGKTLRGCQSKKTFTLEEYPVYFKVGSLIPMNVENSHTGFGTEASKNHLTVLLYPNSGSNEQVVPVFYDKKTAGLLSYKQTSTTIAFESKDISQPVLYRVHGVQIASAVNALGVSLTQVESLKALADQASGIFHEGDLTWIKTQGTDSVQVRIQ